MKVNRDVDLNYITISFIELESQKDIYSNIYISIFYKELANNNTKDRN